MHNNVPYNIPMVSRSPQQLDARGTLLGLPQNNYYCIPPLTVTEFCNFDLVYIGAQTSSVHPLISQLCILILASSDYLLPVGISPLHNLFALVAIFADN